MIFIRVQGTGVRGQNKMNTEKEIHESKRF